MQHTVPEAASLDCPAWLVRWAEGGLFAARQALETSGHVAVITDLSAQGLPPALGPEIEAARGSASPQGYLIRRSIARAIAGAFLKKNPGDLVITRSAAGAPRIDGGMLHLSFSARGEIGVIALGCSAIGVDYEDSLPPAGVPWNMLRADERALLAPLSPQEQSEAFLALWRAKEAALKALGQGFRLPPESVEVTENGAIVAGRAKKITILSEKSAKIAIALP